MVKQMTQLESAFFQIIGRIPTYMRPPYLAVDGSVLAIMGQLGYHVISASIDTKDYENDDPVAIWNSFEKFRRELDGGGTITLAHDVHRSTVDILAQAMIDEVRKRGLKSKSIFLSLFASQSGWIRIVTTCLSFSFGLTALLHCVLWIKLTHDDSGHRGRMSG